MLKGLIGETFGALKGNSGKYFYAIIVYAIVYTAIAFILSEVFGYENELLSGMNGEVELFSTFISFIIMTPLTIGISWLFIDLTRGEESELKYIFSLYQDPKMMFKGIGLVIVVNIFTFLWTLLFIIPGIIKSFSYSQAINIFKDNPDAGILEIITESRKMMDGHKSSLFSATVILFIINMIITFAVAYLLAFLFMKDNMHGGAEIIINVIMLLFVAPMYHVLVSKFYVRLNEFNSIR